MGNGLWEKGSNNCNFDLHKTQGGNNNLNKTEIGKKRYNTKFKKGKNYLLDLT